MVYLSLLPPHTWFAPSRIAPGPSLFFFMYLSTYYVLMTCKRLMNSTERHNICDVPSKIWRHNVIDILCETCCGLLIVTWSIVISDVAESGMTTVELTWACVLSMRIFELHLTIIEHVLKYLTHHDRQTIRTTDDTDHGRYGPPRRPAEKWDRDTSHLHRGAYPSTAAIPPRCLASLVAVTDTYDGYERCSLTDLMDMYTCMPYSIGNY